ncbi:MAG: tetratricopeptide repeat protein [bacterium]
MPKAWWKIPKIRSAYNLGNAYYRSGSYSKAAESFQKATGGPDLALREQSFYNLGNSLYKAGEWEKAVPAYERP